MPSAISHHQDDEPSSHQDEDIAIIIIGDDEGPVQSQFGLSKIGPSVIVRMMTKPLINTTVRANINSQFGLSIKRRQCDNTVLNSDDSQAHHKKRTALCGPCDG